MLVYYDQFGKRYSNPPYVLAIFALFAFLGRIPLPPHPKAKGWRTNLPKVAELVCKPGSEFVGVEKKSCRLWWKNANGRLWVRWRPSFSCRWTFLPARALVEFSCHSRVCGCVVVAWNFVGEECRVALCVEVRVASLVTTRILDLMISCLAVWVPSVGWTHYNNFKWALQQVHPHGSTQAVLQPKLDAVAKLVAFKNAAELDEITADRLKFWTQRALLSQSERRSWLQGAPEALKPLVAEIHGRFLDELALACGQDFGLAAAPTTVDGTPTHKTLLCSTA